MGFNSAFKGLNNLFKFHRSKEGKEILMKHKLPVYKPLTLC